jgi:hypothetical protein
MRAFIAFGTPGAAATATLGIFKGRIWRHTAGGFQRTE